MVPKTKLNSVTNKKNQTYKRNNFVLSKDIYVEQEGLFVFFVFPFSLILKEYPR